MVINHVTEIPKKDVLYGYCGKDKDWVEVAVIEEIKPINGYKRHTIKGWDKDNRRIYFQVTDEILGLLIEKFPIVSNVKFAYLNVISLCFIPFIRIYPKTMC